jgi:hypothetical protein
MTDPRLADHATGLELQIEELVVRRDQARHDGWTDEIVALDGQIEALHWELGLAAEQAADQHYQRITVHRASPAGHRVRP